LLAAQVHGSVANVAAADALGAQAVAALHAAGARAYLLA
jgi:hypothetical protein